MTELPVVPAPQIPVTDRFHGVEVTEDYRWLEDAAAEETVALLTVADSGIGIPERDQKELFTRFFRASNAVERAIPGTGLGLAIVRTILDNHGGELTVTSTEGTGTTVTARLPLLPPGGNGPAHEVVPDHSAGDLPALRTL